MVDPLSLKRPPFRQTHIETTSSQGMIPTSDNTLLHRPPPLQPLNHKFNSSSQPSSVISTPQSQELPSKVSNLTHKNHFLQRKSISVSRNQGKTHAAPDEHDNKHLERFFKNEAIIKEGPKGDGFKCCSFGMCLPSFGKAKAVKARKGGTVMDHPVNDPVNVMSNTFSISFETFGFNSGVTQGTVVRENHEDDSISSYFELPSAMF